jgi:hypothetical protein
MYNEIRLTSRHMQMFRLVCRLFAVLPVSLAPSFHAYAVEKLRVLVWPGYAGSDLAMTFEQRFNGHVEVSFNSLPEKFPAP